MEMRTTKPKGDGQCVQWSQFFVDVVKGQGIEREDNWVQLTPKNGEMFLVNNWKFAGDGTTDEVVVPAVANYPYVNVLITTGRSSHTSTQLRMDIIGIMPMLPI